MYNTGIRTDRKGMRTWKSDTGREFRWTTSCIEDKIIEFELKESYSFAFRARFDRAKLQYRSAPLHQAVVDHVEAELVEISRNSSWYATLYYNLYCPKPKECWTRFLPSRHWRAFWLHEIYLRHLPTTRLKQTCQFWATCLIRCETQ